MREPLLPFQLKYQINGTTHPLSTHLIQISEVQANFLKTAELTLTVIIPPSLIPALQLMFPPLLILTSHISPKQMKGDIPRICLFIKVL